MNRKVTNLLIVLILLVFTTSSVFADGKQPPPPSTKKGNFSKGNFSKKNAWSNNGKALTPPDPNASTWGNTVPMPNGLAFLLVGSFVYLFKRIREEDE